MNKMVVSDKYKEHTGRESLFDLLHLCLVLDSDGVEVAGGAQLELGQAFLHFLILIAEED